MSRDRFACVRCLDDESNLQVHHKKYVRGRKPWEYPDEQLETLCWRCHEADPSTPVAAMANMVISFGSTENTLRVYTEMWRERCEDIYGVAPGTRGPWEVLGGAL